jgi:hypothetical protein
MAARKVFTGFAVLAIGVGVLGSVANAAAPSCGSKVCSDEAAASGLSGKARRACLDSLISDCQAGLCSCTGGSPPCSCVCGDGLCGPSEDCGTCPQDCGTCPPPATFLDFTTSSSGGAFCGNTQDGSAVVIKNLTCGGLNIGSSFAIVPEIPTPDGAISRFALSCTGSSCTIGPTSTAPPVNTAGPDCTAVGCNFGTPLPIPNPAIPSITTCLLNTWSSPAGGFLDLTSGTSSMNVALASDVYVTGNLVQPCPRCSATGTPSRPGMGTCDRGPRAGMACTTTSSTGYTRDCPTGGVGSVATPCPGGPGTPSGCAANNCPCTAGGGNCCDGSHVGEIPIDLSPLTTGTASDTDPGGLFCPGQTAEQVGCFGSTACRTITENGAPAGPISTGVPASATLASVFCIAATGNGIVDATHGLPGPAAISLPGTYLAGTTTTTCPTTTTTTTLPLCGVSPGCGFNAVCTNGQTCLLDTNGQCACVGPPPTCGQWGIIACGGTCPAGEQCALENIAPPTCPQQVPVCHCVPAP